MRSSLRAAQAREAGTTPCRGRIARVAFCAVVLSCAPAALAVPGRQGFSASVELVRVNVGVYDPRHGVIPKLSAADFRVLDNGVEQEIFLFLEPADTPLHVALVIDTSGSMEGDWPAVERAARQFIAALAPRDCVFVVPFDNDVAGSRWGRPDDSWDGLFAAIGPGGGTALYEALIFAARGLAANAGGARAPSRAPPAPGQVPELLQDPLRSRVALQLAAERAAVRVVDLPPEPEPGGCAPQDEPQGEAQIGVEARRAVVLLSDGRGGGSPEVWRQVAEASRTAGVPIFTVILGDAGQGGARTMISLARDSGGLGVEARGATSLFAAFDAVMGFLDATYVLAYRAPAAAAGPAGAATDAPPGNVGEGEWHTVEVELIDHPGLRPLHGAGYWR